MPACRAILLQNSACRWFSSVILCSCGDFAGRSDNGPVGWRSGPSVLRVRSRRSGAGGPLGASDRWGSRSELAARRAGPATGSTAAHVAYPAAARLGDTLTASASEVTRSSRLAIYCVDVAGADGKIVAVFTGTVFITGDAHQAPVPGRISV